MRYSLPCTASLSINFAPGMGFCQLSSFLPSSSTQPSALPYNISSLGNGLNNHPGLHGAEGVLTMQAVQLENWDELVTRL